MGKLSVITNRIKRCEGLIASLVLVFVVLNAAPVFADKDASPEQLLKGVRKAVSDFTAGAEPFDDLTMLGLEYNGTERS